MRQKAIGLSLTNALNPTPSALGVGNKSGAQITMSGFVHQRHSIYPQRKGFVLRTPILGKVNLDCAGTRHIQRKSRDGGICDMCNMILEASKMHWRTAVNKIQAVHRCTDKDCRITPGQVRDPNPVMRGLNRCSKSKRLQDMDRNRKPRLRPSAAIVVESPTHVVLMLLSNLRIARRP